MKGLLAALRFLTILPVPGKTGKSEEDLASSTAYFPVIGLIIGVATAGLAIGLNAVLPPMLVAIMLVITIEGFSGCLHLDGLADTMDGFLSSRPRSQVLDIMRDSRNGTMGVAAIVSVMLIKSAVFGSLSGNGLWHTALLMPLAGRCGLVLNMSFLPYARPEGGLATIFYKSRPKLAVLWSTVMLLAIAWFTAGFAGLIAAAASLLSVVLFAIWCSLKIGGATGDTLGAGCEISEAVLGLAMAAAVFSGV